MKPDYIKVKFLKNGKPAGRSYTYITPVPVKPGQIVQINEGNRGMVMREAVNAEWVKSYGAEKIKSIMGPVIERKNGAGESRMLKDVAGYVGKEVPADAEE